MLRLRLFLALAALAASVCSTTVSGEEPPAGIKAAPAAADKEAAARRAAEEYELQKLFADTLDQVERNYVTDISRRELMEAAIRGVLSKLDSYSNYINPGELGSFKTSVENQFGGIGVQLDLGKDGRLTVVSPLIGTPAHRAGIQAGDLIVEIEGEDAEKLRSMDQVVNRLKGEPGTSVTITTLRPATKQRETHTLKRELIQFETVLGHTRKQDDAWDFMLDPERRIGYIRLTAFSRETEKDLLAALEELKQRGVRGLIFDLRFNPGGLLSSAVAVADAFVTEGRIVSTSGRNTAERTWEAHPEGTFDGFPMVVLVNRYSASASEVVSACLQDHHRAVVIGERTWGKGSVQNVIEMEGGKSALKLTTASYQRPSGKNIHRFPDAKETDEWGVMPDAGYELKLSDGELLQLVTHRFDPNAVQVKRAIPPSSSARKGEEKENKVADETNTKDAEKSGKAKEADNETTKKTAKSAEKKPARRVFVDRQLQKAIDYLSSEVAKAK